MAVPSTQLMKYLHYRMHFYFFQYTRVIKSLTLNVYMPEGILMSTDSQITKNKSVVRPCDLVCSL